MGIAAFLLKNVKIDGWLKFEIDRSRLVTLASFLGGFSRRTFGITSSLSYTCASYHWNHFHHPAGSCQKVPADFHPHLVDLRVVVDGLGVKDLLEIGWTVTSLLSILFPARLTERGWLFVGRMMKEGGWAILSISGSEAWLNLLLSIRNFLLGRSFGKMVLVGFGWKAYTEEVRSGMEEVVIFPTEASSRLSSLQYFSLYPGAPHLDLKRFCSSQISS